MGGWPEERRHHLPAPLHALGSRQRPAPKTEIGRARSSQALASFKFLVASQSCDRFSSRADHERTRLTPDINPFRTSDSTMPTKHDRFESHLEIDRPRKRHTSSTPKGRLEPNATHVDSTRLGDFNRKFLERFQGECAKALECDSEGDLTPLFEKYGSRYSRLREARKQQEGQRVKGSATVSFETQNDLTDLARSSAFMPIESPI